ncbi:MAG: glycerate kinase [Actinomycetota bacterium]|nr:glycerate kinase [Actinomycetota bacterium]
MPANPRIVVAPDKYKGCLSALEVAQDVGRGLTAELPDAAIDLLPIADGGDGTVDAAVLAGMHSTTIAVAGPLGDPLTARIAVQGQRCILELAELCGLRRLPGGILRPLDCDTRGLGEAIATALDLGALDIVIGVGGSASQDAGLGALSGLGVRVLDARGHPIERLGARNLARVADLDLATMHPRVPLGTFRLAADVDAPLLGPTGAVAVYGAQKGLTPDLAPQVEDGLAHVADVLERVTGRRVRDVAGMGAAGGVPTGLASVTGASLVSGGDFMIDMLELPSRIAGADLVVTGEGSFDEQTLQGKGPAAVIALAQRSGVPAAVVAGRILLDEAALSALPVLRAWSLVELAGPEEDPMRDASILLVRAGRQVAQVLAT